MPKDRSVYYNYYQDWVGKRFRHLLDYYEGDERQRITESDTYIPIGSWANTTDDNEDPTFMGFDFYINYWSSPLFNGEIEGFIGTLGGIGHAEVASRSRILNEFKKQFLKFFKVDSPEIASGNVGIPKFNGVYTPRGYYLKSIKGLNNIIESSEPSKLKQFVKYGTDMIELSFVEDVSQNIGYLASLYKALSWSRLNGKQVIPENLLRFDATLVVTEARKMNRVVYNETTRSVEIHADKISNYEYSLYECQFFFPSMPHGDEIRNDAPLSPGDYVIKFSFKFSTLKFNKLISDPSIAPNKTEFAINNAQVNPLQIKSKNTNNNTLVQTIVTTPDSTPEFPNNQNNATETARNTTQEARGLATTVNNTPVNNENATGTAQAATTTTTNTRTVFESTNVSGGEVISTNAGGKMTTTVTAKQKIVISIVKHVKEENTTLQEVTEDDGGVLGEAKRNESETNIADRLKNLKSNTPQIMTPVDEKETMEIAGDQLTTASLAFEDTASNPVESLGAKQTNRMQNMGNLQSIGSAAAGSADQLTSTSLEFGDTAGASTGSKQTNKERMMKTLGNLQNISSAAGERAAQSAKNLRQLPRTKTLSRINNFLNQSVVGQSPTLSKAADRLLNLGRRKLKSEIFKQASLLDRSLAKIKFKK